MNSYNGNVGLLIANTAKLLFKWLDEHGIPYDELHVGKPWPGKGGFYVDDKSIRPDEFMKLDYDQILKLVGDA
jgi:capsule biosynthesis phosphatase